jgi:hypothetical protein
MPVEKNQPPLAGIIGRSPRREVFLAGIPHLLFGLVIVLANLTQEHSNLVPGLSTALLGLFLGLSAGVAVYAWKRGWPLWTAAWYSYAFWLLVVAVAYLVYWLGNDNWILNSVMALGSIAAIGLGYLILFRISRLHALLIGLFLLPVASQLGLESIPETWEAFIALFFGLMAGLASAYTVLSSDWAKGVTAALLANLFAGVALTYISFYQTEIPGFYGDTAAEVWLAFLGYLGAAAALFLGPWVLWGGYDLARRKLR